MSHTRTINSGRCAYCGDRAVQTDHLITKNQARRRAQAQHERENPHFKVRACRNCNEAKGTRLLVPESHEYLIPQLEAITMGKYRVWRGDPDLLRTEAR